MSGAQPNDVTSNILQELRRGAIVVAVLAQLRTEQYGYSLKQTLSVAGIPVEEGTLYPLLRRLEAQKLLDSRWVLEENRPRRYYKLSRKGDATLATLSQEWNSLASAIKRLKP